MKVCIISGFAVETIAPLHPSYSGLEWMVGVLGMELAREHEVTVIATEGSKIPNCEVVEVIKPHWSREAEKVAFERYKHLLPQFDAIIDSTHWKDSWAAKKENPSLPFIFWYHDWFNTSSPCPVEAVHVAPSKAHAEHLSKYLGKVHTIHHGIPVEHFPFRKDRDEFLLYLGRITPYKGVHEAIKIAKETNHHLIIAGEDHNVEDPDYVWAVMKACQRCRFEYLGRIDLKTKLDLLSRAKALVYPLLPPYMGVFELILAESLACGAPVIVTDRGSPKEVVKHGETGFVVEKPDDMIKAVKEVEEIDPKACRKWVEENFSSRVMAKRFNSLTKSIAYGNQTW